MIYADSLPEDTSPTDYAVVKRPTQPGGRFLQVASLLLEAFGYDEALGHVRRTLAGDHNALATNFEVDPQLETASSEHAGRYCPFCMPAAGDRAALRPGRAARLPARLSLRFSSRPAAPPGLSNEGVRSRCARSRRARTCRPGGRRASSSGPTRGSPSPGPSPACPRVRGSS